MRDAGRSPVEWEVSPVERPPSENAPGQDAPGDRPVPPVFDERFELLMRLEGLVVRSELGCDQRELLTRLLEQIGLGLRSIELLSLSGLPVDPVLTASTKADCWQKVEELYRSLLATVVRTP